MKLFSYVTVGIGNSLDITFRAAKILSEAQMILVEQSKPARQILLSLKIPFYEGAVDFSRKDAFVFAVNEGLNQEDREYLLSFLHNFDRVAMISDSGSPLFEDPGFLIQDLFCGFDFEYIPGVTSLGAMMMRMPSWISEFWMKGFLPRDSQKREDEWKKIKKLALPVFLMETPYRHKQISREIACFLPGWRVLSGYELTTAKEEVRDFSHQEFVSYCENLDKGEFVLFLYEEQKERMDSKDKKKICVKAGIDRKKKNHNFLCKKTWL